MQCWIYEHFSSICDRRDCGLITDGLSRVTRWWANHSHSGDLQEYMRRIGVLIIDDIIWTP